MFVSKSFVPCTFLCVYVPRCKQAGLINLHILCTVGRLSGGTSLVECRWRGCRHRRRRRRWCRCRWPLRRFGGFVGGSSGSGSGCIQGGQDPPTASAPPDFRLNIVRRAVYEPVLTATGSCLAAGSAPERTNATAKAIVI